MGRIDDILLRVRDTLADHDKDRWPDDRLLRLVDEAQKVIVRRAKLLRSRAVIPAHINTAVYKLPDDLMLLDRVLYLGQPLPLVSHDELDDQYGDWEDQTGQPFQVVYDKQNRGQIKLFPIPESVSSLPNDYKFVSAIWQEDVIYAMDSDYGIIAQGETGDSVDSDFGFTVDVDNFYFVYIPPDCNCDNLTEIPGSVSSDYGLVGYIATVEKYVFASDPTYGIVSDMESFLLDVDYGIFTSIAADDILVDYSNSDFGVLTEFSLLDYITVYYLRKPKTIDSFESELEIDEVFDTAIKHYVVGRALRDDMDTQNRAVGNEELSFFEAELRHAIKDDMMDFTRSRNAQYTVKYIGGFDG